jgi:hypothetical protein
MPQTALTREEFDAIPGKVLEENDRYIIKESTTSGVLWVLDLDEIEGDAMCDCTVNPVAMLDATPRGFPGDFGVDRSIDARKLAGEADLAECLRGAQEAIEQGSRDFHEHGYCGILRAREWRAMGVEIDERISDDSMVSLSERGPMIVNGEAWK